MIFCINHKDFNIQICAYYYEQGIYDNRFTEVTKDEIRYVFDFKWFLKKYGFYDG